MTENLPVQPSGYGVQPLDYDEIELMDILQTVWKWKYLILVGTLICIVAAAVISLNMTKVYSVGTVLIPGVAKVAADGKITYIGSPREIKALI